MKLKVLVSKEQLEEKTSELAQRITPIPRQGTGSGCVLKVVLFFLQILQGK